jgi:hypothetical protein
MAGAAGPRRWCRRPLPDAVEQGRDELAAFERRGLLVPEPGEVLEQRFGLVEGGVDRRSVASELFLDGLAHQNYGDPALLAMFGRPIRRADR